ncbi:MAG TPA: PAS domain S-box protein [Gemmataceae bacterium]|nr:PAS domain S-box protein [Gemmataceae bacterium]
MSNGGNQARDSVPHLRGVVSLLTLIFVVSFSPLAAAAGPEESKFVVVVYPDESDGAPGIILVNRAIRSTFASQSPGQIEVHNEYVNTARMRDADFIQAQVALLRQKLAGRKVDLVIAGLSSGLDFVMEHRDKVFPGVPVVYVAVDEREVKSRRLPPDVIGAAIRMDLGPTLDGALRLHPHTRRVYVIAGSAPFDVEWEAEARRTFRPYEDRLEFVYLTGLPMDDLLTRVAGLPEHSIIYYLHIHQDGNGRTLVPAEALEQLASKSNAPLYSHVDTYVGRGIVGGRVFTFEAAGNNAAQLGLRILAGEKPESIAVPDASANVNMFDWRQLRRWGISEQSLAPDSVVRYKEPTFWDTYRWKVIGVVSLTVIQALLIAALVVQLVKRRRADDRFRQVVETAPTGMLTVGRDGAIGMANAQVERLFGYGRGELLGRPIDQLVPERLWGPDPADRDRFFAAVKSGAMGVGRDLVGRRKDGTEFPIELGLSPLPTARGLLVLASVTDLTERRQAEDKMRTSQQELKRLTGRLLEAQEVERRRVARELHDDVNQGLALLSMEMDLLAGIRPTSSAEIADRVLGLSGRVKELSSSVHDLSHQLHPSKLEHLGLVTAVRGLCRELEHSHGLHVKFTHQPDPGEVPVETALCLYRIVQEALRNVVKHSGTDHAAVELSGTADGIRLRVSDDGIGFDPAQGNGGLGLVSMRERLDLVGGQMAINSRPGGGTRIDVHVALPEAAESAVGESASPSRDAELVTTGPNGEPP